MISISRTSGWVRQFRPYWSGGRASLWAWAFIMAHKGLRKGPLWRWASSRFAPMLEVLKKEAQARQLAVLSGRQRVKARKEASRTSRQRVVRRIEEIGGL